MMLFESLIFNLLPAAVGIMAVVLVFESCWRKCPPDKLMIVSGAGKMRSVSGKGTFVIPLLQRVDTLSLGAVQVQLTTENVQLADGLSHKCVLCSDENEEGTPDPACAKACPVRALEFGSIEDLRAAHGDNAVIGELGDTTAPNVVIGLHRDADKGGTLLNLLEITH